MEENLFRAIGGNTNGNLKMEQYLMKIYGKTNIVTKFIKE